MPQISPGHRQQQRTLLILPAMSPHSQQLWQEVEGRRPGAFRRPGLAGWSTPRRAEVAPRINNPQAEESDLLNAHTPASNLSGKGEERTEAAVPVPSIASFHIRKEGFRGQACHT